MSELSEIGERDSIEAARASSPRAFGLLVTGVLLVVGLGPLLHRGAPNGWLIALGALSLALSLAEPRVFAWPARVWQRFGEILSRIIGPVTLALAFFLVFVPIGCVSRLLGRRILRLEFDRSASSYWIQRDPPGPPGETLRNQF